MDGEGAARQDGPALMLQIYPRPSRDTAPCCSLQVGAEDTAAAVARSAGTTLGLDMSQAYSLLEVRGSAGEERLLEPGDLPLGRVRLWPPEAQGQHPQTQGYYFILEKRALGADAAEEDYDDLCDLPALTEDSILAALRRRFHKHDIYTYASGILIAINPYRFLPIYNPKYVKMYENLPLTKLSPHIFAVADVAYRTMLRKQVNQCVVISGESGSGKTQSTNFLIHCLTALSHKGCSGALQRTILGTGPVLEAFGNARTAQNNNSSRFGKFIQVTYLESGVVRGAVVEKYLLEKCRLVFRDKSERNYHVFYYLLVGATREERKEFHLLQPQDYLYLKQEDFHLEDEQDLRLEYKRLHQAMEMVGFLSSTKKQIFSVLSAILYLGNVTYTLGEDGQVLEAGPADVLTTVSDLLKVKKEMLVEALTKRRATTANDTLVLHYTLNEATTARDSMAKSLYSALFDWMVLHINHALLNRRDMEESTSCLSIGILDIFGFEDFQTNSFEQFCINYANESLHYYCNQHIFKLEQEEYQAEGITWHNIDYTDNMDCIQLISKKPTGLFHLLDEESNLPQATDGTLLEKLKRQHQDNPLFVPTTVMEPAFVIQHYAGRVKYQITGFREKNTDHMRPDIIALLRGSERAFLRQLVGSSPVALFRWGILRATIRILSVFKEIGRRRAEEAAVRRSSRKSLRETRRPSSVLRRLSSNSLTLDFSFDRSDEHPLDVFEDIFTNYEKRKKNRGSRQKQLIPKNLMDSRSLKHIVGRTLHDRTTSAILHPHQKRKPPSISAQFQASLNKLMETIEKAEPFFIHCIRSNAEKASSQPDSFLPNAQKGNGYLSSCPTLEKTRAMHFDDELVLQQIKYTGLLETVRIQKSGYSSKYTFQEFVEKFRVLLPKGATAAPGEITELLQKMGLDQTTYQIGKTKVFLKEKDSQRLQDILNKEVMRHIITLQRWFRSCLIRIHFLDKKDAAKIIQRGWRDYYDVNRSRAATVIQAAWRTSLKRSEYLSRPGGGEGAAESHPRRQSVEKRGLTRQRVVEHSPSRAQSEPVNGEDPDSGQPRERRGSPPPLNRPLSLPLDAEAGRKDEEDPHHYSSLQRYTHAEDMRDKAARWKERLSDDSSPEPPRPRSKQAERLQRRGKSLSVDELAKLSSSGSDSSPSTAQVKVRIRKLPKRRRRLAQARSGLVYDFGGSREKEYWSFPLPPMPPPSPQAPGMKASVSAADVRAVKPRVKFQIETDGCRFSLPLARVSPGSSPVSSQAQPTTPERLGFLSKILRKRPARDSQIIEIPMDKGATLPSFSPPPYRMPSQSSARASRKNPTIRISRATRAELWNASLDREITDTKELRHLDEFLGNQVNELRTRILELSATESIFLTATMQFRDTIKSMYSVPKPRIGYNDLMKGYQNKVTCMAGSKQKMEVQLVVNLFQSVLDGFIRGEVKREEARGGDQTLSAKIKKRRKKDKCPDSPLGHMFSTYQVNIMQSCDLCGSYIWGMEKAYMCSACKLVCHKKCLTKIITDCSTRCARKDDSVPGSLHFGVHVCVLTSQANPVPKVVEMMLLHVEMNGLYTEGIYRKSGSTCRARELHQILETDPDEVSLENYPIHTITGLVKRWLRELPDPLMTFTLYNDFLHCVELPDKSERLRAVYQKLDELPSANFNTLERLIFHLVRVAKEEEHNRMSANSLAIVFAPCVLRTPHADDPFLGMKDVGKTTMCVEILIKEQFRRYTEKLQNIQELEYAEALALNQLRLRRQNTIIEKPSQLDVPGHTDSDSEAEKSLIERIKSIKEEKEELACRLPELEQENSDNDNLDSESSMSSESLLEERLGNFDSEGKVTMRSKTQKPDLGGATDQKASTPPVESRPGHRTDVTQSLSVVPDQDGPSQPSSPPPSADRKTLVASTSYDDLDIPFIDEDV